MINKQYIWIIDGLLIDRIFHGRTFHRINSIDKTTHRQDISQIVKFRNKGDFLKPRWIFSLFQYYLSPIVYTFHARLVCSFSDERKINVSCLWNVFLCIVLFVKWFIYEMTYSWYDFSMKCLVYEITYHKLAYLCVQWPTYELTYHMNQWTVLSMKCPIYKMTCLWNDLFVKWPICKMTYLWNDLNL